jgi:hypothetical protein
MQFRRSAGAALAVASSLAIWTACASAAACPRCDTGIAARALATEHARPGLLVAMVAPFAATLAVAAAGWRIGTARSLRGERA